MTTNNSTTTSQIHLIDPDARLSASRQNWSQWSNSIKNILMMKGLWEIVSGAEETPMENEPAYKSWAIRNAAAIAQIINNFAPGTLEDLRRETKARHLHIHPHYQIVNIAEAVEHILVGVKWPQMLKSGKQNESFLRAAAPLTTDNEDSLRRVVTSHGNGSQTGWGTAF